MKTALTIAGSDSSGGAGIQADIKTMTANGVFAMSAITALTAQNTTGVTDIFETTPRFLAEQLDAIFTDIYPDAVKIGMVSSAELIDTIAEKLHTYEAKHIVVDPVMVATSGSKLLRDDAVQALTAKLLPMAEVLTPNIPEAEILSGMTISDAAGMEAAAKAISEKYGCAVLCKGGHQINDADAAAGCHNPFFVSEKKATGIPPSQRVPVKAYSALGASSAGFSPFLLTSADTFSTSSGSMARARSTLLEPSVSWMVRTQPSLITRNATGWMLTPAPEPPPNRSLLAAFLPSKSVPPEAKPKLTLDTGRMVVPSSVVIGLPMMVLASTISWILSMVTFIMP